MRKACPVMDKKWGVQWKWEVGQLVNVIDWWGTGVGYEVTSEIKEVPGLIARRMTDYRFPGRRLGGPATHWATGPKWPDAPLGLCFASGPWLSYEVIWPSYGVKLFMQEKALEGL